MSFLGSWTRPNTVPIVFQGGDLSSRLDEAERALALKQDLIDKLKEEVEQQKGSLETVPVLAAQVQLHIWKHKWPSPGRLRKIPDHSVHSLCGQLRCVSSRRIYLLINIQISHVQTRLQKIWMMCEM